MQNPTQQIYPIFRNVTEDTDGIPVLAAPFKTVIFSLQCDSESDFGVYVFKSDQELPPNIGMPQSPINDYSEVQYTDQSDGALYGPAGEFNPSSVSSDKSFNVETTGARWIILSIRDYSAGTVVKSDISLFSNFI